MQRSPMPRTMTVDGMAPLCAVTARANCPCRSQRLEWEGLGGRPSMASDPARVEGSPVPPICCANRFPRRPRTAAAALSLTHAVVADAGRLTAPRPAAKRFRETSDASYIVQSAQVD
jgi:hypothetical protein